jgi:hypothetical protein
MSDDIILSDGLVQPMTMKPTVSAAKALAERIGACQVVVVAFDGSGMFSTTTYGVTREACREIKKLGDAISEALESGDLPEPDYKP